MLKAFHIYIILTLMSTLYFFYNLYQKERQMFIISIITVKSKFYFCLFLNFVFMILILCGKALIKIFFDEIRQSEFIQVIEKIRMKFLTFLLLFITFRPSVDLSIIFIVVLYHFISILNWITFKRSDYIVSIMEPSKIAHLKILITYFLVGFLDYFIYNLIHIPIFQKEMIKSKSGGNSLESLIYYVFACEFIFLLLKLIGKFIKLSISLTQINMGKNWNYKLLVFNIISILRYSIKLMIEIRFCIVLFELGVVPIFFIIDVFNSCWHLIKLGYKFYENYKLNKSINNLDDYIDKENNDEKNVCNICLDDMKFGKKLNCGHIFHIKCLKEWIMTNTGCPICKIPIEADKSLSAQRTKQLQQIDENIDKKQNIDYATTKIPEYNRINCYKQVVKLKLLLNKNEIISEETSSVAYSLPCAAVYNRSFENEIKRLEIENYNKKLLEYYENPVEFLAKFEYSNASEINN